MNSRRLALPLILAALPLLGFGSPARQRPRHVPQRQLFTPEILAAKQQAIDRALTANTAAGPAWTELGPASGRGDGPSPVDVDSGRLTSIVIDPTDNLTVYVANAGGGIWKTTNADPTVDNWNWVPLTDNLTAASGDGSISVGALAMDPSDPLTLYAGLGDRYSIGPVSQGLYVTHDGGTTWTQLVAQIGASMHFRQIYLLDSTHLLALTDAGLFAVSSAGAVTPVSFTGLPSYQAWQMRAVGVDLVISLEDYSSGLGTLWWSSNGAAGWNQASVGPVTGELGRIVMDTAPASATEVRAVYEDYSTFATGSDNVAQGILVSHDAGRTYTYTANAQVFNGEQDDGTAAFYSMMLGVDPRDPTRIFAGTSLCLWRTTNDGTSWDQIAEWIGYQFPYAHADYHVFTWTTSGSGATVWMGNDGGLSLIRDPYRPISIDTGNLVQSDPTFIDNQHNAGLIDDLVYNVGSSIAKTPANTVSLVSLGTQDNGTLVRTSSGTVALSSSSIFDENFGGDGFSTLVHAVDGLRLIATSYNGVIYVSSDGGATFNPAGNGITLPGNESFYTNVKPGFADPTGNTVFHNSFDTLYQSVDFGNNFTTIPVTGIPTGADFLAVGSSHLSPKTLAIAAGNHTGYITHDLGQTWIAFPTMPNSGSAFPGLHMHSRPGADGDLPTAGFDDADDVWIDSLNDDILYEASESLLTTKSHLWQSVDGGKTFTAIDGTSAPNGFPTGLPVRNIKNDPRSSQILYASTEIGVYRSADFGLTWNRYGTGMPYVSARELYLAPDGSFLRVGTYGRGVWQAPLITVSVPGSSSKKKGCSCSIGESANGGLGVAFVTFLGLAGMLRRRRRA